MNPLKPLVYMKYFVSLILTICLSWGISQAQAPLFKLRPAKKKTEKKAPLKKSKKATAKKTKKAAKKTSITDRYRQKKNRRRQRSRLNPRSKTRKKK